MNAHRKRRAEPAGDYGPRARLDNGTAVLTYRPDPDKPNAPAIRAATAYVAYEALWSNGLLTDVEREAADRICVAAELVTGAKTETGAGSGGRPHWDRCGFAQAALIAARHLNDVDAVLDRATVDAVARLVCKGDDRFYHRAKAGLAAMAAHWGME